MDLLEAIAVYLYLRDSNQLGWNRELFDRAWGRICREAEKVKARQV